MENPNSTVLAVNDLPEQLQLLTFTLKAAGYDVLETTNPNGALKLATEHQIDLIINDFSRPSIEGLELLQRIRSVPSLTGTPILFIASLHLPDQTRAAIADPETRDDFLEAPYTPTALIRKIARLIERKHIQDELRHSKERYIELFDNANDIVYTHDLEGHYTSLNKKGQAITGYTCEEAAQLEFNTLATPEDVALAKEMLRRKLDGDETSTIYEISIRAKDGTSIPVEVNTQLIYENGSPIGVQGIARDIRARKEAEEQFRQVSESLLEAERRAITEYKILLGRIAHLAQALASARNLTPIFNALLKFTTISLPCDALGIALYDHEHVELSPQFLWIQNNLTDVTDLEPFPLTTNSDVQRAIVSGETIISSSNGKQASTLFQRSQTNLKPLSTMTVPMTIMGRTIGTLEIQSTTRNAYQREHTTAVQMAANLAANTIENVRLLNREREQDEKLRHAQKMEAIGQLTSGIAHDFNNICTAFFGHCDILSNQINEGDPLRKHVNDLRVAAKRAASLTKQLLTFSRKQVIQPTNLDLNTVIKSTGEFIRSVISEDISIITNLASDLPQIKADRSQIEQIIMNLAVNARDAMPNGGRIVIETSLAHSDDKQKQQRAKHQVSFVQLSVADTGTGMSAETQQRAFEPYFTTKEEGKGTGLGLATVYGCVKQSGGSISLDSKEGKGTTFKILFPTAKEQLDQLLAETHTEPTSQPIGNQTILIAEDDMTVREVLHSALSFSGYNVLEAPNGREGWELFQQNQNAIELVITDVLMPEMNGSELALRINRLKPATPVLYISGHATNVIIEHGVLLEDVAFIEKPFNTHDVLSKVHELLKITALPTFIGSLFVSCSLFYSQLIELNVMLGQ